MQKHDELLGENEIKMIKNDDFDEDSYVKLRYYYFISNYCFIVLLLSILKDLTYDASTEGEAKRMKRKAGV